MNENLICYLIAYLLGGVPFGLVFGKIFGKVDITKSGSGSIGATNVLRVLKQENPKLAKKIAILTVAADALKGVAPILIARVCGIDESVLWMMATLSVVGHCFSPCLKFEGGKGIATGAGVIACFLPLEIAIALATWFIVGKTLKISSVASLAALGALIVASFILHPDMSGIHSHAPLLIIAFIVVYKHAPNIKRLIVGEEKKVI